MLTVGSQSTVLNKLARYWVRAFISRTREHVHLIARNRYVRKLLYQACQSASQPSAVGEKLSTVTETHIGAVPMGAHRHESESQIPQSSQDFSLTPEKIAALQAEKKALRHRKNIEAMKQELPDTPSVALTTTTI